MRAATFPHDSVLPWQGGVAEDLRFRKILLHVLGVFAMIAIMLPFLPKPIDDSKQNEAQRTQFTRLVIEEKALPPPKPKVVEPKVEKPKPIEKPLVKPAKPKPVPVKPVEVSKPKPKPVEVAKPRVDQTQKAREKAAQSGLLAMADDLAAMRQQVDVSQMSNASLRKGDTSRTGVKRNLLAGKSASASVAGISGANLSRESGEVAIASRQTTQVAAPVSSSSRSGGQSSASSSAAAGSRADSNGRSSAAVRQVMDSNKGAIFAIYNRALRKDSTLAGKLVVNMVIEPSGRVSAVDVVSSELSDNTLVKKILSRIRLINFGADVAQRTEVNYSFDFLPY